MGGEVLHIEAARFIPGKETLPYRADRRGHEGIGAGGLSLVRSRDGADRSERGGLPQGFRHSRACARRRGAEGRAIRRGCHVYGAGVAFHNTPVRADVAMTGRNHACADWFCRLAD